MKNWQTLKKELLKNKQVAAEYKRLEPRYQLISQLIEVRIKKGLTQEALAQKVGAKQSAIARIESGQANPTLSSLEKIVQAIGSKLVIRVK